MFRELVDGASPAVPTGLRDELPELLWLAQLGVTLFWVYDGSPGQRRTRTLVEGVAPLIGRLVRLSRLPVLRGASEDVLALVRAVQRMSARSTPAAADVVRRGRRGWAPSSSCRSGCGCSATGSVPRSRSLLWPVVGLLAAVERLAARSGRSPRSLALPFALARRRPGGVRAARPVARDGGRAGDTGWSAPLALVAERAGWGLLGFDGDYLALTVPHMLFAGFGACLVVGLVAHAAVPRARRAVAAAAVPLGRAARARRLLRLGRRRAGRRDGAHGRALVRGGRDGRPRRVACGPGAPAGRRRDRSSSRCSWRSGGRSARRPDLVHPSLSWMAATHGVANALGFVLCTLLGLRLLPTASRARPGLTYAEVGATQAGPLPAGYRHLRVRHLLVPGVDAARSGRAVGDALLRWRVHEAAHVERARRTARRRRPGVRVVSRLGVGPRAPDACRARWSGSSARPDRVGFGYGTLPGHLFRGEEAFTVERDDAGDLWFVVTAFSVPDRWWVRLARARSRSSGSGSTCGCSRAGARRLAGIRQLGGVS